MQELTWSSSSHTSSSSWAWAASWKLSPSKRNAQARGTRFSKVWRPSRNLGLLPVGLSCTGIRRLRLRLTWAAISMVCAGTARKYRRAAAGGKCPTRDWTRVMWLVTVYVAVQICGCVRACTCRVDLLGPGGLTYLISSHLIIMIIVILDRLNAAGGL